MTAAAPPAWNLFKQIFADHWDGFKRVHPRYDRRYYDGLVEKMLGCGNPDQMGYIDYRCLRCGEGTHRVAMSCKSSLCLRCAKVYVDTWVSQVSQMLHEGVIYRHIVLTMPALLRTTFYQNAKVLLSAFGLSRCCGSCCPAYFTLCLSCLARDLLLVHSVCRRGWDCTGPHGLGLSRRPP